MNDQRLNDERQNDQRHWHGPGYLKVSHAMTYLMLTYSSTEWRAVNVLTEVAKTLDHEDRTSEAIYVADGATAIVRRGNFIVCCARSHTMALRIANSLNDYIPNEKGV